MAELGRREQVQDPLAFNPRENTPARQLSTSGVGNPGKGPSNASFVEAQAGLQALGSLRKAAVDVLASKKDDMITQGKLDYMSGVTEADMIAKGERYTQQGYETLSSVDKANSWYLAEQQNISDKASRMDPKEYKAYIMKARADQLKNLPEDPAVRKVYIAAFEDLAPRLVEAQFKANNEFNANQGVMTAKNTLISGASANADASRVMPNSTLRVSPTVVSKPVTVPVMDRDILIKTVLGEAAGESEQGMAAVAHVIKNRASDKRWPGSVRQVALQDNQFSAWNKGAGGNNPDKWKPGTPAYERAGRIVDIVMAGRHVDPTGGATHYYSPGGMKQLVAGGTQKNLIPKWLDQEAARSGGTIRLGNHIFVGRSSGTGGGPTIENAANAPTQTRVGDTIAVPEISDGSNAVIDANKQAAVDLGRSAVIPGVDIQADALNSPQAVAAAAGIPTAPPVTYNTQVQSLLENIDLTPDQKALALAQAYEETLDSGNDQLFNDGGGLGTLTRLGADEKLIDRVAKAKDRFDKKELDKYDVSTEKFRSDVIAGAKAGQFESEDEIYALIDEKAAQEKMSEQDKRSLAREAINVRNQSIEAAAKKTETEADKAAKRVPVAMFTELSALYTGISENDLTAEEAAERAIALGEKYGTDPDVVAGLVKDMFTRKESATNKLRTEAESAFKKKQKSDQVEAEVRTALTNNTLKNVTGTVVVGDKEIPAKEFGIQEIQKSVTEEIRAGIAAGKVSEEGSQALYYKMVYGKLRKMDVVDEKFGAQLNGALTGNIVNKNGELTDSAKEAFDVYMQFRDNPELGASYFEQMVKDPQTRALVTMAGNRYDGRLGMDDALLKAHELIQKGADTSNKISPDLVYTTEKARLIDDQINAVMETPGMFTPENIQFEDKKTVINNKTVANQYVLAQANNYAVDFPLIDAQSAIQMAVTDFGKNAVVVGNNILIGREQDKQRLDQVMGLEGSDRTLPNKAIADAIRRNAPGMWGQLWEDEYKRHNGSVATALGLPRMGGADIPPYYATYNPQSGAVTVQLMTRSASGTPGSPGYVEGLRTVGKPMIINAAAAGARLREEMTKPSWLSNQVRAGKEALTDAVGSPPVDAEHAQTGSERITNMFKGLFGN